MTKTAKTNSHATPEHVVAEMLAALKYIEQFSGPLDSRQVETLRKRARAAIAMAKQS